LGDINDDVVAYQYYVEDGEQEKADKEKQKIITEWSNFITWVQGTQLPAQYSCLGSNLIH
jgi:hypothetical protein